VTSPSKGVSIVLCYVSKYMGLLGLPAKENPFGGITSFNQGSCPTSSPVRTETGDYLSKPNVTSHPSQLSLAILPSVSKCIEYQPSGGL